MHVAFNFHAGFLSLKLQRSLVIIVMILLCWITLGGLVFSLLMQLSFIDGLYFTVVSIETIGFGDIHPTSTASRVFGVIYNRFALYFTRVLPTMTFLTASASLISLLPFPQPERRSLNPLSIRIDAVLERSLPDVANISDTRRANVLESGRLNEC